MWERLMKVAVILMAILILWTTAIRCADQSVWWYDGRIVEVERAPSK
jgi:hypothetical protein